MGKYVQLNKRSVADTACDSNGLLSRDENGATLSCQSGYWKGSGTLSGKNCKWVRLPGQGNGGYGVKSMSCPVSFYMVGLWNYRGGDWTRTGHFAVQCCQ